MTIIKDRRQGAVYGKYKAQRSMAKRRAIEWQLTFEQWCEFWMESGHWHERGVGTGKYVMARFNDVGPYAVDNIKCITHTDNVREAIVGKSFQQNETTREAKRQARFAWYETPDGLAHKEKLRSQHLTGRWMNNGSVNKIVLFEEVEKYLEAGFLIGKRRHGSKKDKEVVYNESILTY